MKYKKLNEIYILIFVSTTTDFLTYDKHSKQNPIKG